ncbi:MAG TPA: sialidase family protein, partial [Roseiflexaceae bacterium]
PTAQSAIWSLDAAIDGNNIVHLLYITQSGPVIYQTFSTTTDLWAPPTQVANSAWPNRNNGLRQGSEGVSLAIDAGGLAHVVYGQTQSGKRRVYYNNNQGGTWNHEVLVDDQPNSDNSHATLAFGSDGALYVAWLADDGTHGAIRVRAHRNGAWQPASAVDANVFRDQGYSIDQGPNLLVTPDGKLHVVYIGTWESVPGSPTGTEYGRLHHKYSGDGGATWTANDPPTRYTHSPALATDPQGNLYVFGHREYWKANRCANMLVNVQPAGGAWGAW